MGGIMKQTATIKTSIPDGNKWTVFDIEKSLKKEGIKCKTIEVMNHLKVPKDLIKIKEWRK